MGFSSIKAEDLIEEIAMGPFGSNIKKEYFTDDGIPVLNGGNLTGYAMNDNTYGGYVSEEKAESLGKANASRGDVVITHRGTLGQAVYIPDNSRFDRYVISQSQFRIKCNERILPEYMVYYLHTPIGQYKLLANKSQVGVPALARPTSTFKSIVFEVPEMDIQKRIVAFLEKIRAKIEINDSINKNLAEEAETVFDKYYSTATNQQPFTSIISVLGGGTPKTSNPDFWNGPIPFFTPKDVGTPYTFQTEKYITEAGLNHCNSRLYPKDTSFVTARGTVGKVSLAGTPMAMNQSCYALASDTIDPILVYFYVLKAVDSLKHKASGAVFDAIVTRDFDTELINVISDEESRIVSSFITPMMESIHNNVCENIRLSAMRDSLLPKLMSGELDVSQLDI